MGRSTTHHNMHVRSTSLNRMRRSTGKVGVIQWKMPTQIFDHHMNHQMLRDIFNSRPQSNQRPNRPISATHRVYQRLGRRKELDHHHHLPLANTRDVCIITMGTETTHHKTTEQEQTKDCAQPQPPHHRRGGKAHRRLLRQNAER